jgi:hypothetical protein
MSDVTLLDTFTRVSDGLGRHVCKVFAGDDGHDNTIRLTDDAPPMFRASDVIRIFGEIRRDNTAVLKFKELLEKDPELAVHSAKKKCAGGTHQQVCDVVDMVGIRIILNNLKNRLAITIRAKALELFTRYIAGDDTLHAEIEQNRAAAADAPEDTFLAAVREEVAATPVPPIIPAPPSPPLPPMTLPEYTDSQIESANVFVRVMDTVHEGKRVEFEDRQSLAEAERSRTEAAKSWRCGLMEHYQAAGTMVEMMETGPYKDFSQRGKDGLRTIIDVFIAGTPKPPGGDLTPAPTGYPLPIPAPVPAATPVAEDSDDLEECQTDASETDDEEEEDEGVSLPIKPIPRGGRSVEIHRVLIANGFIRKGDDEFRDKCMKVGYYTKKAYIKLYSEEPARKRMKRAVCRYYTGHVPLIVGVAQRVFRKKGTFASPISPEVAVAVELAFS